MRADRARRLAIAIGLGVVAFSLACESASAPGGSLEGPSDLSAEAVGTTSVRVSWRGVEGQDVAAYEVERRADLQGEFQVIESNVPATPAARIAWFDTRVDPNTYYGYRVRAVSRLGARSGVSNIAGTKTASMPGIRLHTTTTFPNAESADPDGYTAVIRGARDTQSVALGVTADRFVAVGRGAYTVALRGLAVNCAPPTAADSVKSATVTDEGTATVTEVSFTISCRDPKKASIVVAHQTTGDTVDADGIELTMSGIILEAGTPADERVYFQSRVVQGRAGATRFDNLRLGDYDVSVADIDAPCTLDGATRRTLQPRALAVDTVRFALTCRKPATVDTAGKPFILRHRWSASSARPGDKVSLLTSIDLRAQPSQQVAGVSATIGFDNAVVRYDSARTTGTFDVATVNRPQPSVLAIAATNTDGSGESGDVAFVRSWFTVVGAAGSSVRTATTLSDILTPQLALLTAKTRVEEASLAVSATAPTNQPPTARITAPATATAGTAVSLSGTQSSDSDGTIASYAWTFGDGTTGTGATVSHAYAAAGSVVVKLTVTDDAGATGAAQQTIVVSGAPTTTGTIAGTVSSPQGGIGGVTVSVAGGGSATTTASGAYTIAGVATGARSVTVSGLPANCTVPAAQTVTVTANATTTVNITVPCGGTATSGTIGGRVTRASDGSGLAGVSVVAQPAGGAAIAGVTTSADGSFTIAGVPLGTGAAAGTGSLTVGGLPSGCTNPGSQSYSGVTAGVVVTKNITITCTTGGGAMTYPFTATWGTITNAGPTGRQVTLTFAIDMGPAPGRADVAGSAEDPLAGISFAVAYNGTLLDYQSRVLLAPNGELDLGVANEIGASTAAAQTNVAIGSTSGQTVTGSTPLIRLLFNIAAGASGAVTPTVTISEALATNALINVTSSVAVGTMPALTIP